MTVDSTKFYQFIANYSSGENWVKEVDSSFGDGNGTLTKTEFTNFLKSEWDWNGEESSVTDLVNKFWKEFDTNTSSGKIKGTNIYNSNGLDGNETLNAKAKVELYKIVSNQIQTSASDCANIIGSKYYDKFLSDAESELFKKALGYLTKKNVTEENLETVLKEIETMIASDVEAVLRESTAEYCALEEQDAVMKELAEKYPDYKIADDKTLQLLIKKYLSSVNTPTKGEDGTEIYKSSTNIQEDIKALIDAYLAEAGIPEKEANLELLVSYGYNTNKLNDLQKNVAIETIKTQLADLAKDKKYEKYQDDFDTAVQQFIDKLIENDDYTFAQLLEVKPELFEKSDIKKKLDNTITIRETYGDFDAGDDFHKVLAERFGETLADKIANNERYIATYKEIIAEAIDKVNNGDLTLDEVEDFIANKVASNLEKFFTNGLGDMSLEELATTYTKLAESAELQTDDDVALKQHRDAAISYCEAVISKGSKLEEAVKDVFGNNWKSKINGMLPSEIKELMAELIEKVDSIGDVATFTINSWNDGDIEDEMYTNQSATTTITANITDQNGSAIDSSRVSYTVTATNGTATIDALGNLKITTGNTSGYMKVKIYAMVDGVQVGEPKEVVITCKKAEDKTLTETDLGIDSDITTGAVYSNRDLQAAKDEAKQKVKDTLENIRKKLIAQGFDKNIVNTVVNTLIGYYSAIIDGLADLTSGRNSFTGTSTGTYTDEYGNQRTASTNFYQISRRDTDNLKANDSCEISILEHCATRAKNHYFNIVINGDKLEDKFMEMYNRLAGEK